MMTYAVLTDFVNTFGEKEMIALTNLRTPSANTVNSDSLSYNQQKAFALINGYISNCAAVAANMPFSAPYLVLLIGYELDITRYFLDLNKPREDVKQRYDDAIRDLKAIGKGDMSLGLGGINPQVAVSSEGSPSFIKPPDRIFSRENLSSYTSGY